MESMFGSKTAFVPERGPLVQCWMFVFVRRSAKTKVISPELLEGAEGQGLETERRWTVRTRKKRAH